MIDLVRTTVGQTVQRRRHPSPSAGRWLQIADENRLNMSPPGNPLETFFANYDSDSGYRSTLYYLLSFRWQHSVFDRPWRPRCYVLGWDPHYQNHGASIHQRRWQASRRLWARMPGLVVHSSARSLPHHAHQYLPKEPQRTVTGIDL